jgi:hypothetical protein
MYTMYSYALNDAPSYTHLVYEWYEECTPPPSGSWACLCEVCFFWKGGVHLTSIQQSMKEFVGPIGFNMHMTAFTKNDRRAIIFGGG